MNRPPDITLWPFIVPAIIGGLWAMLSIGVTDVTGKQYYRVQTSENLAGPWTDSGMIVTNDAPQKFLRLEKYNDVVRLRWDPSPDTNVAGYRVTAREFSNSVPLECTVIGTNVALAVEWPHGLVTVQAISNHGVLSDAIEGAF